MAPNFLSRRSRTVLDRFAGESPEEPSPLIQSPRGSDAPTPLAAEPEAPDDWQEADFAIGHLVYAVKAGLGADAVRNALDDVAETLARHVDRATPEAMPQRTAHWRRLVRQSVGADGADIDLQGLMALRYDVAAIQARQQAAEEAAGVDLARTKDGGYLVNGAGGARLLGLPPIAGGTITADPARFSGQLRLLKAGLGDSDPDALKARALNVFSIVHEREHDFGDRLLTGAVEARADAFVTAVGRLKKAETAEEREAAEAMLRMTLFAEAVPANRLASFGMDLLPGIGNARSAEDFGEDVAEAYRAFSEGRIAAGAGHSFWALVDGIGMVGGLRFGKLLREVARTTKPGRRLTAALDLARMEANGRRKQKSYGAAEMFGKRYWSRLDSDQQNYMEGLFSLVKGRVGENIMSRRFADVGAPSFQNAEAVRKAAGQSTPPEFNPRYVRMKPQHGGRRRDFDDVLEDGTLKRLFGMFMFPKSTPGKKTPVEMKTVDARRNRKQKQDDLNINKNKHLYNTNEILLLRSPYKDLPKTEIRNLMQQMMKDPKLSGQEYITTGKTKNKMVNSKKVSRVVKWTEDDLERMISDVERRLTLQSYADEVPTLLDFLIGIAARMSAHSSVDSES